MALPRRIAVTHTFPVASPAEMEGATLPLAAALEPGRLRGVVDDFGFAVVTGVLSDAQCADMEHLFGQDLAEILDGEGIAAAAGGSGSLAEAIKATAVPAAELVKVWPRGTKVRCHLCMLHHV